MFFLKLTKMRFEVWEELLFLLQQLSFSL